MSITATLTRFERVDARWLITILYTDTVSGDTVEKPYNYSSITKRQLRNIARAEAAAFGDHSTTDIDIPLNTTIDVTPASPTPPTQAEIDRVAWFTDWNKLKQLLELTTNVPGLATTQSNTRMANLRTSLEADWKNSYLRDI